MSDNNNNNNNNGDGQDPSLAQSVWQYIQALTNQPGATVSTKDEENVEEATGGIFSALGEFASVLEEIVHRIIRFPGKFVGGTYSVLLEISRTVAFSLNFLITRLSNLVITLGNQVSMAFGVQIGNIMELFSIAITFTITYIIHRDQEVLGLVAEMFGLLRAVIYGATNVTGAAIQGASGVGQKTIGAVGEGVKGATSGIGGAVSGAAKGAGSAVSGVAGGAKDLATSALSESEKTKRARITGGQGPGGFGGGGGGRPMTADDFRAFRSAVEDATTRDRLESLQSSIKSSRSKDSDAESVKQELLNTIDEKLNKVRGTGGGGARTTAEQQSQQDRFKQFDKNFFDNISNIDQLIDAGADIMSIEPDNDREKASQYSALLRFRRKTSQVIMESFNDIRNMGWNLVNIYSKIPVQERRKAISGTEQQDVSKENFIKTTMQSLNVSRTTASKLFESPAVPKLRNTIINIFGDEDIDKETDELSGNFGGKGFLDYLSKFVEDNVSGKLENVKPLVKGLNNIIMTSDHIKDAKDTYDNIINSDQRPVQQTTEADKQFDELTSTWQSFKSILGNSVKTLKDKFGELKTNAQNIKNKLDELRQSYQQQQQTTSTMAEGSQTATFGPGESVQDEEDTELEDFGETREQTQRGPAQFNVKSGQGSAGQGGAVGSESVTLDIREQEGPRGRTRGGESVLEEEDEGEGEDEDDDEEAETAALLRAQDQQRQERQEKERKKKLKQR